jgi:hypothetical protein
MVFDRFLLVASGTSRMSLKRMIVVWSFVLLSGLVFGFVVDSSVRVVDKFSGCSLASSVYR